MPIERQVSKPGVHVNTYILIRMAENVKQDSSQGAKWTAHKIDNRLELNYIG